MKRGALYYLSALTAVCLAAELSGAAGLPGVPREAVEEMGVTDGVPLFSGFVFVDGNYLPPPYTVTRRGNAVYINRVQIEQPVPWSYFSAETPEQGDADAEETGPADEATPGAMDEGGRLDPVPPPELIGGEPPRKVESIDDLFGEADDAPAPPAAPKPDKGRISSIDELFGDVPADRGDEAPVAEKRAASVNSIDDLFSDDTPKREPPPARRVRDIPLRELDEPVVQPPAELSPEELNRRKKMLKEMLDEKRAVYEKHLARGELYFFGTSHDRVNGTYGSARALMEVLPSAMRYARNPADLLKRLHSGNVFFIDYSICEALFRNKNTFPLLQQRLEQIQQDEAVRAARKSAEEG